MTGHAKGPWVAAADPIYPDKISIETPDGYYIATVDAGEYQDANAALILAAPDMLEALEEIYGWLDGGRKQDAQPAEVAALKMFAKHHKVIKKAKGKS